VRCGEIMYPQDVVNGNSIFIFTELSAHPNCSVLGKQETSTCAGQFPFLWGWYLTTISYSEWSHLVYLSILLDTALIHFHSCE
jgi:muramidase (phage lysozyme)